MADINLERKDATIWPWVVGLLALALVIWGVWAATDGTNGEFAFDDDDQVTETQPWDADETADVPQSVRDFLDDCAVGAAPGQPGQQQQGQAGQTTQQGQAGQTTQQDQTGQQQAGQQDQWGDGQQHDDPAEYTEHCIDQMITAMEDVSNEHDLNDNIDDELNRLRDRYDALGQDDAESLQYSQNVQGILTSAASLLQQMQQAVPTAQQAQSQIQQMQQSAEQVQADAPIAQQTQEVSQVFQHAGMAMEMMGRADRMQPGQQQPGQQ